MQTTLENKDMEIERLKSMLQSKREEHDTKRNYKEEKYGSLKKEFMIVSKNNIKLIQEIKIMKDNLEEYKDRQAKVLNENNIIKEELKLMEDSFDM